MDLEELSNQECRKISIKYDVKYIDVLIKYNGIELGLHKQHLDTSYANILKLTEKYFKDNYITRETEEI